MPELTVYATLANRTTLNSQQNLASIYLHSDKEYVETPDATALMNSAGLNFSGDQNNAIAVCEHLNHCGVTNLRFEVDWNQTSFDNPTTVDMTSFAGTWNTLAQMLLGCQEFGIYPIITMNANDQGPACPNHYNNPTYSNNTYVKGGVVFHNPASNGDQTVTLDYSHLDPTHTFLTSADFVANYTGIKMYQQNGNVAPYAFLVNPMTVDTVNKIVTANLSQPVSTTAPGGIIPAGNGVSVYRCLVQPFTYKYLLNSDGSASSTVNPVYTETLNAWIQFFVTVATWARGILGTTHVSNPGFGMEIWNELGFGSNFLDMANYYNPYNLPRYTDGGKNQPVPNYKNGVFFPDLTANITNQTRPEICAQTGQSTDPSVNPLINVDISFGWSNYGSWTESMVPAGCKAFGSHFYVPFDTFPPTPGTTYPTLGSYQSIKWIDNDNSVDPSGSPNKDPNAFIPTIKLAAPENWLMYYRVGSEIIHLSKTPVVFGTTTQGRDTLPKYILTGTSLDGTSASLPLDHWFTECGIGVHNFNNGPSAPLSIDDQNYLKAKCISREWISFTWAGAGTDPTKQRVRMTFFKAKDGGTGFGVISDSFTVNNVATQSFYDYLANNSNVYPTDPTIESNLTSLPMKVFQRVTALCGGGNPNATRMPLSIDWISTPDSRIFYSGDPNTSGLLPYGNPPNPRPDGRYIDFLRIYPFQKDINSWMIPVWIKSTRVDDLHQPNVSGTARMTIAPALYTIAMSGFEAAVTAATLVDPFANTANPVPYTIGTTNNQAIFQIAPIDTPQILLVTTIVPQNPPANYDLLSYQMPNYDLSSYIMQWPIPTGTPYTYDLIPYEMPGYEVPGFDLSYPVAQAESSAIMHILDGIGFMIGD